jgi:hypothetical protein
VGHRTLVAVEDHGGYALYHDQWGGLALAAGTAPGAVVDGAVASGRRIGTGLAVTGVLDALDSREYESLVVRESGGTSAYAVVWLGLDLATGVVDGGTALVPFRPRAGIGRLRRHLRAAKGRLGDAVDAGVLSGEAAVAVLRAGLAAHPAVPRETVWLPDEGGGRESQTTSRAG